MQYQFSLSLLPAVYAAADPGSLGGLLKLGAIVAAAGVILGILVLAAGIKMTAGSAAKNTKLRDHGRSSGLLVIGILWTAVGFLIISGVAVVTIFGDALRTFIGF